MTTPSKLKFRFFITLSLSCFFFFCTITSAQTLTLGQTPEVIEVFWQSSKSVSLPGFTDPIVLDEEICRVELNDGRMKVFGLARGETVVLGMLNGARSSVILRVMEKPVMIAPPSLGRNSSELLGQGIFTSNFQIANSGSTNTFAVSHGASWGQRIGDTRLNIRTDVDEPFTVGTPNFNIRTASIQLATPVVTFTLLDFNANLGGSPSGGSISHVSTSDYVQLRGADVAFRRGANSYEVFAGTSIPSYFLSLGGTRNVAGFTIHRQQTERLQLYASTSVISFLSRVAENGRETTAPQSVGFDYRMNKHWSFIGRGGFSENGGLILGEAAYAGNRFSGAISAQTMSLGYGLNQIQLSTVPGTNLNLSSSYKVSAKVTQSTNFQHSVIGSDIPGAGISSTTSDYFNTNTSWAVLRRHQINFNYTLNRTDNPSSTSNNRLDTRYDFALNSQIREGFTNMAQVILGHVDDPFQISSQSQYTLRDGVSVRIPNGNLLISYEHNSIDPSLVSRLNQRLGLISPQLQALFLSNPAAFVESANLPPQIRDLLSAEQPNSDTISANAQLRIGDRISVSPTVSFSRAAQNSNDKNFNHQFGYTASYQMRQNLQLRSTLSNLLFWDTSAQGLRRSTFLTFGFSKSFTGSPSLLLPTRSHRQIQGRVFRDSNINGTYNDGEPGIPNITVELSNGQKTVTDGEGRYRFTGLGQNVYRIGISLAQFKDAVRVTTPADLSLDLAESAKPEVDFGVVNFARVIGNIYNDYLMRSQRELDANGIRDARLVLDGPVKLTTKANGTGDYDFDNVPPGDYQLSLETDSLPPNYAVAVEAIPVHVEPVSTVLKDIPVRAFRSIAGRVLLKIKQSDAAGKNIGQDGNGRSGNGRSGNGKIKISDVLKPENGKDSDPFVLVPLAGVQLSADHQSAITDADGKFLLRDLPAGEFTLTVVPNRPLPENLKAPAGIVRLTKEPQQIQGATIVISSAELAKYLVPEEKK
jgi:hypothetical protein